VDTIGPQTWVAIYAAIVATTAVLLNFKTWLDSGPRLKITVIPDGMTIGGGEQFDERDLIIVNVINRGNASAMITNLTVHQFDTCTQRIRNRPARSFVIANPQLKGYPPNIPADIEPSKRWTGAIRKRPDIVPEIHNGHYYVGISTTHQNRPLLKRIPKKRNNPMVETPNGTVPDRRRPQPPLNPKESPYVIEVVKRAKWISFTGALSLVSLVVAAYAIPSWIYAKPI
jgi:hypothetical protein